MRIYIYTGINGITYDKNQVIFIITHLMHCCRTYLLIQNPIVPTEPVFDSLPFSKTVLQVFVGNGAHTKSRVTSDSLRPF